MKLYKFRSLAGNTNCKNKSKSDYCKVIDIIKTGKFWCSNFWELNDPMEGLFYANPNSIKEISKEKEEYKICSFSGINGFKNPLLWGYYANGFKGVVIEIEIEDDYKKIYRVEYFSKISSMLNSGNNVEKILTRKLDTWKHEDEFRFVVRDNSNAQTIGIIKNVFFGAPYSDLTNSNTLEEKDIIKDYKNKKKKLIKLLEKEKIRHQDVKIYDNGIYVGVK